MQRATWAVAALALAACGRADDGAAPQAPGSTTDVTITVTTDRGAEPRTFELRCDPPGGDHPNPAAACEALAAAGASVFAPVPRDRACTQIFGGPQNATVTGTVAGRAVDAEFTRSNGCEIARWDALGTEVFDVPLQ